MSDDVKYMKLGEVMKYLNVSSNTLRTWDA